MHRTRLSTMEGPDGPIPIVGVRSASDHGSRPEKRAQYHLFDVETLVRSRGRPRFRIHLRTRGYDPDTGAFEPDGSRELLAGD